MHRFKVLVPALAALAMTSGALAEEPAAQAAVRSFKFTYGFTVKDVPADAQSIKVWIPTPQSNAWQTISSSDVESSVEAQVVTDPQYGNNFVVFDFSNASPSPDGTYSATVSWDVTRHAHRPLDGTKLAYNPLRKVDSPSLAARWLSPDTMVPLDGKIAAEAKAVANFASDQIPTTVELARKLYDHIVDSVKYDKSGPAGTWGRGDALYACDFRAGNCTDFHSLFIGEARSLGIPARFTIGFSIPTDKPAGDVAGYHCWGEFWDDTLGWLPVDASEAAKAPARRDELFGGLDADRVDFAWGRDIALPGSSVGNVNFIIYPHIEVDGVKWDKFDKKFAYENK
jgi:transglutaminase-like putative cysteine protease